jgi:hypothetical protein
VPDSEYCRAYTKNILCTWAQGGKEDVIDLLGKLSK